MDMEKKIRAAIGATAVFVAIAGVVSCGAILLSAITSADTLTKFVLGAGGAGAGSFAAVIAGKRE